MHQSHLSWIPAFAGMTDEIEPEYVAVARICGHDATRHAVGRMRAGGNNPGIHESITATLVHWIDLMTHHISALMKHPVGAMWGDGRG